jgi:hypothetical protein
MIAGHGSPIAEKGPLVIAALVAHGSRAKAALVADVNPATIKRWLSDPEFAAQLATAQREHAEETMQALRGAMLGSVELLVALRDNPSTPDTLRRQCAYDILVLGKNALESADLAERLGKLESALEAARHDFTF